MINDITVIIPTHFRHQYIERSIEYWTSSGLQVVIIDSSDTKYNKNIPDKFTYLHKPGTSFAQKISETLNTITTKFLLISADDDFISFEGIKHGMRFLKDHSDYNSVHGQFICFEPQLKQRPRRIYHHALNMNLDAESYEKRLLKLAGNYMQIFYSVFRTESIKKVFNCIDRNELDDLFLIELSISFSAAIMGKHKTLPNFWAAREISHTSAGQSKEPLPVRIRNNAIDKELALFKSIFKELHENDNAEANNFLKLIDRSLTSYSKHRTFPKKIIKVFKLPDLWGIWLLDFGMWFLLGKLGMNNKYLNQLYYKKLFNNKNEEAEWNFIKKIILKHPCNNN